MGYYISIRFSPGQQDKINNRTYVNVYLSMNATAGYYAEHSNGTGVLTVNGQNYPFSSRYYVRGSSQVIHSVSVWIDHEPNGTKRLTASAYFDSKIVGTFTTSDYTYLNEIPRASWPTTSKQEITFGEEIEIFTNRKVNTFKHELYAMVNNDPNTYTKIGENVTDRMTWTLPESWKSYFPNSNVKLLIRAFTFNGANSLGRVDAPLVNVKPTPDMLPDCEIKLEDETENFAKYGGFVQYQSKAKIILNNTFKYNASLLSQSITADDLTYSTGSQTISITNTEHKIIGKVIDSRQGQTITTKKLEALEWHIPTIHAAKIERCRANGLEDGNGDFVKITFDIDVSSLNNKNKRELTATLKRQGLTNGEQRSIKLNAYKVSDSIIMPCSSDYAYEITLKLADDFEHSLFTQLIATGFTLMDFHTSGRGMAIGKVSEKEGLLDINLKSEFRQGISIQGNQISDFIISREEIKSDDNNINWTVCKYASGDLHAWGNGKIIFPAGNSTAISSWWWRKVIFVKLPIKFKILTVALVQGAYNGFLLSTNDFAQKTDANNFEVHIYSTRNMTLKEEINAHFEIRGQWK